MKFSVSFSELEIETRNGRRRICVVTPTRDILLSRKRLEVMRSGQWQSELDRVLVEHVRADQGFHALLVRGTSDDGSARYGLDLDLDPEEEAELIAFLLRAQFQFFRQVEPFGVFSMLGVGFTEHDRLAYERAADRLADALAKDLRVAPDGAEAEAIRVDQWLLERQATWTAVPYETFVETRLAGALVAAERQRRSLRQLASQSSPQLHRAD